MTYEWARFVWWLGPGQGASIVVALLTAVLAYATLRYVVLTRRMAEIMSRQLTAAVTPDLDLALDIVVIENQTVKLTAAVTNRGEKSFRVVSADIRPHVSDLVVSYPLPFTARVVAPNCTAQHEFIAPDYLFSLKNPRNGAKLKFSVIVQDMSALYRHRFIRSSEGYIFHHLVQQRKEFRVLNTLRFRILMRWWRLTGRVSVANQTDETEEAV